MPAEFDGLYAPNANGDLPLIEDDPQGRMKLFLHVDAVIAKAEAYGLVIGLLPAWGDKVWKACGKGPEIFNEQNAKVYGKWLVTVTGIRKTLSGYWAATVIRNSGNMRMSGAAWPPAYRKVQTKQ